MVLSKQREEDEKVSVVGGRGELRSDEARPWRRRRKNGQWPSPTARMARLRGGGRRGKHGGAIDGLADAFLQRQAGTSVAELARQQWRSGCASATVGSEGRARNGNVSWEGRRARAQAVDSGARPATACGLRGQAAGDAWRTRGHRVRNLSNTVASI